MLSTELLTPNVRLVLLGITAAAFGGQYVWSWWKRRRPKCFLSPLEVRAHDAVEALAELNLAIEGLKEMQRSIPSELTGPWIKARTAGNYLQRFLAEGR